MNDSLNSYRIDKDVLVKWIDENIEKLENCKYFIEANLTEIINVSSHIKDDAIYLKREYKIYSKDDVE